MYHKIILAGYLGRDPEMRYTPSGQAVTNFSVATNRKYTTQAGESREIVTWFRVACWGRLAEVANQYLSKGRAVLVEGELNGDENGNPRIWTGNDGQARASFELTARTLKFLGGGNGGNAGAVEDEGFEPEVAEGEEEIPF